MRPLRLTKSKARQSPSMIFSPSVNHRRKSISPTYKGNITESVRHILPTTLKNSAAAPQCVSDLRVGNEPDNNPAALNVEQELPLADDMLQSQPDDMQKTPVRSKSPMSGTNISADISLPFNHAQTPSVGNRTFSRRSLSCRTPTKTTSRRRRKKRSPPLPPYKYLMTDDTPEDDISSYSSNDTHAIRAKGSMMFDNFRLAALENRTDKMLEIEKWRLDSSSEWPPCT
ncbi:hypothetical protein INT43_000703 [Umbelopsis isabellina]|uniref:Uncharacterized protein n=1 Tax=Mortierella isabellina TaxID=91625 RepID=A0A8H7UIW7_MORIS|nr:hypothetical protein INT43_000703 [Umbelopsis isabellina]